MNSQHVSSHNIQSIKWWIWVYFLALLFEGAFRKWIVPQASDFLLIIRDPIVIWIYFLAIKYKKFPNNTFIKATILISFLLLLAGLINGIINSFPVIITLFGVRTNFLHLFLIYVIPSIFSYEDVKQVGKWILLLSIPISILMVAQFLSPPSAYINKVTGLGDGMQITAGSGKIRPPATFTFISGPACFYPLVMSFILSGFLEAKTYSKWLLVLSSFGLAIALSVSGSRATLIGVGVVASSLLVITALRREFFKKITWILFFSALLGMILFTTPIFLEGVSVLTARISTAGATEANTGGIVGRIMQGFTGAFSGLEDVPFFGYGIGLGTNAGAALAGSRGKFLLAEGEWQRIILESGFLLGIIYLLLRISILMSISIYSLKTLKAGNTLPFLLLFSCIPLLLNGQFGQPTNLGFAVFNAGLTLAAGQTNLDGPNENENITRW